MLRTSVITHKRAVRAQLSRANRIVCHLWSAPCGSTRAGIRLMGERGPPFASVHAHRRLPVGPGGRRLSWRRPMPSAASLLRLYLDPTYPAVGGNTARRDLTPHPLSLRVILAILIVATLPISDIPAGERGGWPVNPAALGATSAGLSNSAAAPEYKGCAQEPRQPERHTGGVAHGD
jgi:hypothetical protein